VKETKITKETSDFVQVKFITGLPSTQVVELAITPMVLDISCIFGCNSNNYMIVTMTSL